jgi:hypothetical protein
MVRSRTRHFCWLRSDLTDENIAMLQQRRPDITFVSEYTYNADSPLSRGWHRNNSTSLLKISVSLFGATMFTTSNSITSDQIHDDPTYELCIYY